MRRFKGVFAGFLMLMTMFVGVGQLILTTSEVYADDPVPSANVGTTGDDTVNTDNSVTNGIDTSVNNNDTGNELSTDSPDGTESTISSDEVNVNMCKKSMGSLGWIVCPVIEKVSDAVDWLYSRIEGILTISPVKAENGSPIYEIWKWCLSIANIVFIIFLLIVIYSQLTGWGINNYGIKKVLPKLIVTAILVNLSFLICSLLVDVSNIIGSSLRGVFAAAEQTALANMGAEASVSTAESAVSMAKMYTSMAGGAALAIGAGVATIMFEPGIIWMMIPTVLGAIVAVATGLITIALRQAVVVLLVMIAPLAFVANILPNTEQYFQKWKKLMERMLVFYPLFSLLFGASQLAGFAIIMSAKDGFMLMLGMAVQIFPLFFSWKLMQMSGTFLGNINSKLRALTAKPLARNRSWAESRRQQTNLSNMLNGKTPMSHLRRYLDDRRALREKNTENLQSIRKSQANLYVQRKISGGYDGTKAQGTEGDLKANKYTRTAKDASIMHVKSETATLDTEHVLNEYGKYFVKRDVRERVAAAKKAGDKRLADTIAMGDQESRRNMTSGNAFLEYSRARMTKENDEEADFYFMVNQYLDSVSGYNPDEKSNEFSKYRHYVMSSAGGLGKTGQTRVLGKIIAQAAAVESNQRRDIGLVLAKYPPDKRNFRNFLFNYYIDDDGYATDKEGNRIESMRDELRVNHPERLVKWDKSDENGPYFDWYDINGKYVTRIYKKDKPAIKELLANFDAPINDPINNMLAIHAGIKEQPDSEIEVLRNMGLEGFRTSIGRALGSFKEKNAAFSPMVAEMIKKGYIKNYAQEYLAYLDSLNKATKPGAWNMQDGDAIDMYAMIMDPDNWEKVFPTELIRGFVNVNGEPIYGIRYDEDGNKVKVAAEEATREELMERVKEKFIVPAARKMTVMMSKQTQNTMDNQKVGTVEKWKKLKEVFDVKWGEGKAISENPYEQNGDMGQITREIRETLYTVDENGNKRTFVNGRGKRTKNSGTVRVKHVNHAARIFDIYNSALDADEFATEASDYCAGYKETAWIADQIQDFMVQEGYGVTKDQIYEKIEELLAYVDYD